MKRQDLTDLGIEDKAIIDKIMDLYGTGINAVKTELAEAKKVVDEKDKTITELSEKAKNLGWDRIQS